jgi:hypothetical protein
MGTDAWEHECYRCARGYDDIDLELAGLAENGMIEDTGECPKCRGVEEWEQDDATA